MRNIEVELRGPITKKQFTELNTFFKTNGVLKDYQKRILIDYSTFLPDQGIEKRNKDIRLRVTNGVPEIMIKIGSWGGTQTRKELSLKGKPGEFDTMVQLFAALGYTKGVLVINKSYIYTYKGIEFALVNVHNHSYTFEAEKVVSNKKNLEVAKKEILEVLKTLEITPFKDKEFFEFISDLNKNVVEVFDIENYSDGDFHKRFKV